MKWCGDGETEPMENLHLGNGISVLGIMNKSLPFCKYALYRVISNYQPPPPSRVWVSGFPKCQWKQTISASHYEQIEKWLPFCKYVLYRKISNYWPPPPPKFGSPVFRVSTEWNIGIKKWSLVQFQHSSMMVFLCLKHLCIDIPTWSFCT